MWPTIYSGFGFWDVYSWIAFFIILNALALFFRGQGRGDYKKGTEQDEIFYGGNEVPEDGDDFAVPASSAYWGFTEALKGFYTKLLDLHTGLATDYVGYMFLTAAVLMALIVL
ncbi:MAG: hydrogenase [Synergistales bacterium]|nr:hydrogenase [Synergistales bacterium]